MTRTSVMLVDDNPKFLRVASLFLKENEEVLLVGLVNGGKDALKKAKELKPDIVVIDLAMPDMPGLEVIPLIRKDLPDVGIIALTMYDTEVYRQAALVAGANSFLAKPNMHTELLPEIEKIKNTLAIQAETNEALQRILILEDDAGLRSIYTRALSHSGYHIHDVSTIDEAEEMLDKFDFSIFICDIQLGDDDSIDLLNRRKAELNEKGTQIVMASGHGQYQPIVEEIGADFFLQKPIALGSLLTLVSRLIEASKEAIT